MSIASELTNLRTNITNAYDAISNKGGTLPANKNTANLATAIDSISSGSGDVVNGIIANFKAASSTIDANTFVEFVNNITAGAETLISSASNSYYYSSAVALDTNRVFVVHQGSDGTTSTLLYGVVCTINGTTITVGTDTQLSAVANSSSNASVVALDTGKVFVAHRNGSYLYSMVCTIEGTTITAGTDTQLSTVTNSYINTSAVALDTNKVFIAHRGGNGAYLYGMICTISGTTITAGTDTQLSTVTNSDNHASAEALDTNRVFVVHDGHNYLYGMVCIVDGATITVSIDTQLSTTAGSYAYPSAVALDTNRVFVAHYGSSGSNFGCLYGMVCTIDGNTVTVNADTKLSTGRNSYLYSSPVKLGTNKVFIAHQDRSDGHDYLYGMVCSIIGATVIAPTNIQLTMTSSSAEFASAVALGSDKVFISHRAGVLRGTVCNVTDFAVQEATFGNTICGLTKTECTDSTAGEVWVLDL